MGCLSRHFLWVSKILCDVFGFDDVTKMADEMWRKLAAVWVVSLHTCRNVPEPVRYRLYATSIGSVADLLITERLQGICIPTKFSVVVSTLCTSLWPRQICDLRGPAATSMTIYEWTLSDMTCTWAKLFTTVDHERKHLARSMETKITACIYMKYAPDMGQIVLNVLCLSPGSLWFFLYSFKTSVMMITKSLTTI